MNDKVVQLFPKKLAETIKETSVTPQQFGQLNIGVFTVEVGDDSLYLAVKGDNKDPMTRYCLAKIAEFAEGLKRRGIPHEPLLRRGLSGERVIDTIKLPIGSLPSSRL